MRPRSANEWRSFWHHGGEEELETVLRDAWEPVRDLPLEQARPQAERIALLLGSSAPVRALTGELSRIRAELGAGTDPEADRAAAERVDGWFRARSR